MRATTLHQPHASLIVLGVKTIETRGHRFPRNLMGERVAIHAGKKVVTEDLAPEIVEIMRRQYGADWPTSIPRGAIVATAVLADCLQVKYYERRYGMAYCQRERQGPDIVVKADPYGLFTVGRWLWMLQDIQKVDPPVPCRGFQGFFPVVDTEGL